MSPIGIGSGPLNRPDVAGWIAPSLDGNNTKPAWIVLVMKNHHLRVALRDPDTGEMKVGPTIPPIKWTEV